MTIKMARKAGKRQDLESREQVGAVEREVDEDKKPMRGGGR